MHQRWDIKRKDGLIQPALLLADFLWAKVSVTKEGYRCFEMDWAV
ncbi:hypothetical protein VIBNIAM115_1850093 [Vibrio nigripulchritudo AM115]|nr:hypothetical protein VIBNIAM115_1850093 [Vibrio nigripulchritudo AM115]